MRQVHTVPRAPPRPREALRRQRARARTNDAAALSPPPQVHETIRVKSAAWDDNGVLIYTTLNHIKYCLPNGDSGIIRTLDTPLYITKVVNNVVYALDREGKNRQIQVRRIPPTPRPATQGCFLRVERRAGRGDAPVRGSRTELMPAAAGASNAWQVDVTEYMFKLALLQRKFDQVIAMIKGSALCGSAIIRCAAASPRTPNPAPWDQAMLCAQPGFVWLKQRGAALCACWDDAHASLPPPITALRCVALRAPQLPASQGLPRGGAALCARRAHTLQPGGAVRQHRGGAAERAGAGRQGHVVPAR